MPQTSETKRHEAAVSSATAPTQHPADHFKSKIRYQSFEKTELRRKIGIAFFLTSLIPILLMLYMVFYHAQNFSSDAVRINLQLLVLLAVVASSVGYVLLHGIGSSISSMVRQACEILEKGGEDREISLKDKSEEISKIVQVFNDVTRELHQKVEKLENSKKVIQDLLKRIGTVVTSREKIDRLLELVVSSLVTALDAESGVLLAIDHEDGKFNTQVAFGKHQEMLATLSAERMGAIGWMIQESAPVILNKPPVGSAERGSESPVPYRSLLCVPLKFREKTMGYLVVINKKDERHSFSTDDELLVEGVASQIAMAMENARLNVEAERIYVRTIGALALAVESRDHYTRGHIQRVAYYAEQIGRAMNFEEEDLVLLRDAAFLHDIGKVAIEDKILLKPAGLTHKEMEAMKLHTTIGEQIIAPLHSFKDLRDTVRHHQEWYDGSGYPDGLKGDDIPLSARVLTVADVYDALTSDRPYRKAMRHEDAVDMIANEAGTHFDPKVVDVFLHLIRNGVLVPQEGSQS